VEWRDLGRWDSDAHALREDGSKVGEGREPGLHLGEIISELRRESGKILNGSFDGEPRWIRAQEGFLWEKALELVAGGMAVDPAMDIAFKRYMLQARSGIAKQIKFEYQGIHMTPDGWDEGEKCLESYKFTSQSMKKANSVEEFHANFWHWEMQEGGYTIAGRAAGLDIQRVKWYVLWSRGDYKWKCDLKCPSGCSMDNHAKQVRVYEAVYSDRDLDEVWAQVSRMKMKMGNKAGVGSV
jgi:hypothetical protein